MKKNTVIEKKEIVIGTTAGDFGDQVKDSIKGILEAKGYRVKLVEFTDYVRPNLALADGSIDVNVFQHRPYLESFLESFVREHNLDLSAVFEVPTPPYGIYGGKLKSLDDFKDGITIAAPNDPSNFARVLVILDHLGWLELKENFNPLTASKRDIAKNPHNIKIIELEAAQLPRALPDVDFAAINGNFVISSGMNLSDALFQEPTFTYVNVGVIRDESKDQPWAQAVIDAYNSDQFKAYTDKTFENYQFPSHWNQ